MSISDFQCLCRECGATCWSEAWELRYGLCVRCAFKPRPKISDDPIRDAIERASHDLLEDLSRDSIPSSR